MTKGKPVFSELPSLHLLPFYSDNLKGGKNKPKTLYPNELDYPMGRKKILELARIHIVYIFSPFMAKHLDPRARNQVEDFAAETRLLLSS